MNSIEHAGRKHSKFAASAAERWTVCTASVALSEGMPDRDSVWSLEGTKAHEVLELILGGLAPFAQDRHMPKDLFHSISNDTPQEMITHAGEAAFFIFGLAKKLNAEILVETRIHLDFIHPEMFGTFDGAVLDHFGTLHVFDFKYGAGFAVSPKENLQMIFYGLGLAHKYQYNFKNVRLWIIQPRIKGYDGPSFWEIDMRVLRLYETVFKNAVWQIENDPKFFEGPHCHWCRARSVCPLKERRKIDEAKLIFGKKT